MQELNQFEIEQVDGGVMKFLADYVLGKALDWAISAGSSGKIDYSQYVQTGAEYGYWNGA